MKRFAIGYALAATFLMTHAGLAADTPPRPETPKPSAEARKDTQARPAARAESKPVALLRPELVVRNAQQLGLTPEQQRALRQETQAHRQRMAAAQEAVRTETAALNELLAQSTFDEAKISAQVDKVLDAEREVRKGNMTLALSLMARLTPEQREQAVALSKDGAKPAAETPADPQKAATAALRAKLQEVQAMAKQRQADGHDVRAARKLLDSARTLTQEGKHEEAQKALDEAKHMLD